LGTLLQSRVTAVPMHWQLAFSTSLMVVGSPSLQGDPIWPATLGQLSWRLQIPSPSSSGLGVPAHWQLRSSTSLVVQALPSSQALPGTAGPPATPLQSGEAVPEAVAWTPRDWS